MKGHEFSLAVENYERTSPSIAIELSGKTLQFHTPNKLCLGRVQTLLTKEPDTIAWLNSMPANSVFLDVGANVGMYSIYAGVLKAARVFAFEPEAQNYALLCRNIVLNNLSDRAVAWCAALSNETKFDRIYLSRFAVGESCNMFGNRLDAHLQEASLPFSQGCFAITIDALVASGAIEVPAFIKIDVDGLEHKIIKGAAETLRNPAVRSILIEINGRLPEHRWIIEHLASLGFGHDPSQYARTQRTDGFFKDVGEYVFRR